MKLILTDIDDTLLAFGADFQLWCEQRGMHTNGALPELCSIEAMLGCSRERTDELLIEYANDGQRMATIPVLPDAREAVRNIRQAFGYEFVAISSCVDGVEVVRKRAANLESVFGFPFVSVHCVGICQSKAQVLDAYAPTFWVEDNWRHASYGASIGHQSILLNKPYNRDKEVHADVQRVDSWHDIFEAVARKEAAR